MFSKYDNWLMTDKSAEQSDEIIARDFRGYPVTENDLYNYILADGELVECDHDSLLEFVNYYFTVIDYPTPQDVKEAQ